MPVVLGKDNRNKMNKRLFGHGKLSRLPRVTSSYRKIKFLLTQVTTWVLMLIFVTSQASAVYTPTSAAELIARSKPVSQIKIQTNPTPVQENKPDVAETASPETKTLSEVGGKPTPEIVIEIKSAEYIPPAPKPVVKTIAKQAITGAVSSGAFPFGQCTYYVATKRQISWLGNAGEWYENARAAGRPVGKTAQAGAIMVSYEGIALGHVAYVERVNPDGSFVVSEMNWNGNWGRVTSRTVVPGTIYIVGFVY